MKNMENMKKTSGLVGALIIGVSVLCFDGLGRPGESQAPSVKETVSKVMTAHAFTPPIALEGPSGITWYVGFRSMTPAAGEQAIVQMRGNNPGRIMVAGFHRERPHAPWIEDTGTDEARATLVQELRAQLVKELATGEKSAKPETDKAKAQ